MARARNIKPGFFKNEDLAECTPWARLCFAGLWLLGDREGRLEDRPKRIKAEIFPFDNIEVEPLLQELARFNFIIRYDAGQLKAIQIANFSKHQHPHYSEKSSVIMPPNFQESGTVDDATTPGDDPENSRSEAAIKGGSQLPESLNPESLNPESHQPAKRRAKETVDSPEFRQFWESYPKKVGKKPASDAFAKLRPSAELLDRMLKAIEAQRSSTAWTKDNGQFVPNPATWLNGRRWDDELPGSRPAADDPRSPFWGCR